ncbi:MAG TPA: recombinase RecA [Clostridia bacterium]|jgi:recombination protein RecA|nr:recombinase RecA [Clostridia bacterium]
MNLDEKKKALSAAIAQIEKEFGKGSIMALGEGTMVDIDIIPTGCLALDAATGIGGVPRGRILEIYGPESSGKTTLALHMIAEAQKMGGIAAFIDAEHALDPIYAGNLGVDLKNLYVSQPDDGEQALNITEELVKSGSIDILVIDSVAALTPKAEIEGEMGDNHVGLQARLMSQALRKLTGIVKKSNTCVVFINQLREKVGIMFGNPETTAGGKALKFYASMRFDVRKADAIKTGTEVVGSRTKVKVVKNKLAAPFKTCEFDIIFGSGISKCGCILDLAVENELIQKTGSWFSYNGERIGQGREKAIDYLNTNPDLADTLENNIREKLGLKTIDKSKKS